MASKDADAEQDLANRRRLRKDIRDRSELVNREMEELRSKPERARKALDQAESAFNDIQHNYTREFVLESGLFSLLGKVVNANAKSLNEGLLDLSSVDVVKKIAVEWKNYDGEEDDEKPINWKGLGESCEKWSRRAPTVYFLHSVLSEEPPPKRTRAVAQKVDRGATVTPMDRPYEEKNEMGESVKAGRRTETSIRIEAMHVLLDKDKAYPYWAFVTDPDSFGQTIENIFAFAFLVNLGYAGLEMRDGDAWAVLKQRVDGAGHDYERDREDDKTVHVRQSIVTIDHDKFRRIIEKYGLKKAHFRLISAQATDGVRR